MTGAGTGGPRSEPARHAEATPPPSHRRGPTPKAPSGGADGGGADWFMVPRSFT